ncbi:penicillin acylase family protein [Conexibacter sp. SYSU D00693]|uniref:penicillin acylase family protein n=1 Tax=Conexibacter sp. SYSU D00693 TaxID=2812560 RepID=UPI00196A3B1C|nr:penicillin acylase family protein [Conexibacter sp. SYSU D00693]
MSRVSAAVLGAIASLCALAVPATASAADGRYDVTVARSQYGIPHIKAKDLASGAYGYARAIAQDNVCTLAEVYVTVNAQRSRWFGPNGSYEIRGNGSRANNLNSDFFYQRINDERRIERLLDVAPPVGPRAELKQGVKGFVAGWNDWLEEVGGRDGIPDPTCRGEAWVRPITEMDVWRRFYQLSLLASSGVAIDGIAGARPLVGGTEADALKAARALKPGELDERLGGLGSNAYGLGKDATASGHGIVYGNPHFPWQGPERFYQAHLTIPGKMDVMGGSLLGVPLINIGFTHGVAWSHTVSTARRFIPYELRLVPGSATSYVVDGQVKRMKARRVTVEAKRGGTVQKVSRTLYSDAEGRPVLTSILGLPVFPWTPERAYVLEDANDDNFGRLLNHFYEINQAQSVDDVEAVLEKYQGIPWVNTIAADTAGNAYYADIGSIPNIPESKRQACQTVLGVVTQVLQRLIVLDGSRSSCLPGTDSDAIVPGILGRSKMPSLRRSDHVSNMNDSYWLTNPDQPLEGFPLVIGDERTARSLRTRVGIRQIQDRLAGRDGLPGNRFDVDDVRAIGMGNRVFGGEVWRDDLVRLCRTLPLAVSLAGPVDVSKACDVLARWDLQEDLDSRGALLFRRFVTRLTGLLPIPLPYPAGPFAEPFDAQDPVGTPKGLSTLNPLTMDALGQAVKDLQGAGLALDAPLRDGAAVTRRGERIPIPGGPGGGGQFNVITPRWNAKRGYVDVDHGSSYVQAVELTPGCPKAHTILTYGESTNPASEHSSDQTKLFSEGKWVTPPFCAKDLKADRSLVTTHVVRRAAGDPLGTVAFTEARGNARPRLVLQLKRAARVVVSVKQGTKVVRRIVRTKLPAGERVLKPRLRTGAQTVTITTKAGRRSAQVRLRVQQPR